MISIVIPFKYDSLNRIENLLELLDYIKNYWKPNQLIVVEMDHAPKAISLIPGWVDYLFAKEDESNSWSRSKRINLSIPLIKNEIMAIMDTDLIVDKDCLDVSITKIINNEIDAVTPFGEVYHFPRSIVLKDMKKNEIKTLSFCEANKKNYSRKFIANGGCFITKLSIFKHIRGMNELFVGWGLEDDELINRYIKLGYRYGRISSVPALHINHERSKNCDVDFKNFDNSLIEKNRSLISSKIEILDYFGITDKVGKYSSINKPIPIDTEELANMVAKEKALYQNAKQQSYEI